MKVREDNILRRDGSAGIYGIVEKPDFALIVPMHDGMIHLVEQYRYPVKGRFWEFPQGSWEQDPGEGSRSISPAPNCARKPACWPGA